LGGDAEMEDGPCNHEKVILLAVWYGNQSSFEALRLAEWLLLMSRG
jgi:hypothetical protein